MSGVGPDRPEGDGIVLGLDRSGVSHLSDVTQDDTRDGGSNRDPTSHMNISNSTNHGLFNDKCLGP